MNGKRFKLPDGTDILIGKMSAEQYAVALPPMPARPSWWIGGLLRCLACGRLHRDAVCPYCSDRTPIPMRDSLDPQKVADGFGLVLLEVRWSVELLALPGACLDDQALVLWCGRLYLYDYGLSGEIVDAILPTRKDDTED